MFDDLKNAYDVFISFVDWAKSIPSYLSSIMPSYIVSAFGTFFLVLSIIIVIKLIQGLISIVSGVVAGFIA